MFKKFWGTQFLILTLSFNSIEKAKRARENKNIFKDLKWTKYLLSQIFVARIMKFPGFSQTFWLSWYMYLKFRWSIWKIPWLFPDLEKKKIPDFSLTSGHLVIRLSWCGRFMSALLATLAITCFFFFFFFFSNLWGLAILTKLITGMRICRTKFGIVMFILCLHRLELGLTELLRRDAIRDFWTFPTYCDEQGVP